MRSQAKITRSIHQHFVRKTPFRKEICRHLKRNRIMATAIKPLMMCSDLASDKRFPATVHRVATGNARQPPERPMAKHPYQLRNEKNLLSRQFGVEGVDQFQGHILVKPVDGFIQKGFGRRSISDSERNALLVRWNRVSLEHVEQMDMLNQGFSGGPYTFENRVRFDRFVHNNRDISRDRWIFGDRL